jgi:hypothetical protein
VIPGGGVVPAAWCYPSAVDRRHHRRIAVYVRPQIDRLRHADPIFILGGFGDPR